ncbi:hypothetical protein OIU76_006894 [Salix suchowensis]|nr:hypothetical protein OIU76_006894 [Salix suchowensis]
MPATSKIQNDIIGPALTDAQKLLGEYEIWLKSNRAAGLSASLLTSVLPTTLEDLLVLGLCTAGGFVAISTFPARRQAMVDQVNRIADGWPCT